MHKLVILIAPQTDPQAFQSQWPLFVRQSEAMPGLRRVASSQVQNFLFGEQSCVQMHELFFDSGEAALDALSSPEGQQAGRLLQEITGGQVTLFLAEHREDDMKRLRKFRFGSRGERR